MVKTRNKNGKNGKSAGKGSKPSKGEKEKDDSNRTAGKRGGSNVYRSSSPFKLIISLMRMTPFVEKIKNLPFSCYQSGYIRDKLPEDRAINDCLHTAKINDKEFQDNCRKLENIATSSQA